jgi:hypothetical protein
MSEQSLVDFKEKIAPYKMLWQSVRIKTLLANAGNVWVSSALRVILSEGPPGATTISKVDENLLYFLGDFPIDTYNQILDEIVREGYVTLPTSTGLPDPPSKVFLTGKLAGLSDTTSSPPTWYAPAFQERKACKSFYGISRPCFTLTTQGDRLLDLLNYEMWRGIEGKLRFGSPGYDGLKDFASKELPGINLDPSSAHSSLQILAPLPFDVEWPEAGSLVVRAPAATPDSMLAVRFFFDPACGPAPPVVILRRETAEPRTSNVLQWKVDPPWPNGSARAKAALFFRAMEFDSIITIRWPRSGNLRAAIDEYFDPGHGKLHNVVLGSERSSAQEFEAGVARLLSLVGVPVIWYGKVPTEGRPDLAGFLELDGDKVIILGECTLEKPDTKFSGLSTRAKVLREKFSGEAQILPVVFTKTVTTGAEKMRGVEHGIALVGSEELKQLFELLVMPAMPRDTIAFLRHLQKIWSPLYGLGEPHRWGSRWS